MIPWCCKVPCKYHGKWIWQSLVHHSDYFGREVKGKISLKWYSNLFLPVIGFTLSLARAVSAKAEPERHASVAPNLNMKALRVKRVFLPCIRWQERECAESNEKHTATVFPQFCLSLHSYFLIQKMGSLKNIQKAIWLQWLS